MEQKRKAGNFQNGGKQPTLNDKSNKINNHEHVLNTTKTIKVNQQLFIFNQWIAWKQLFKITIVCGH